jgi:hypothetical protein
MKPRRLDASMRLDARRLDASTHLDARASLLHANEVV